MNLYWQQHISMCTIFRPLQSNVLHFYLRLAIWPSYCRVKLETFLDSQRVPNNRRVLVGIFCGENILLTQKFIYEQSYKLIEMVINLILTFPYKVTFKGPNSYYWPASPWPKRWPLVSHMMSVRLYVHLPPKT